MRKIFCDMCGKESPKDEMDTITISVFLPKKGWGGTVSMELIQLLMDY